METTAADRAPRRCAPLLAAVVLLAALTACSAPAPGAAPTGSTVSTPAPTDAAEASPPPVAADLTDHVDFHADELGLPPDAAQHLPADALATAPQSVLDTFMVLLETSRETQNEDARTLDEYEPVRPHLTAWAWGRLTELLAAGDTDAVNALVPSSQISGTDPGSGDTMTVESANPYRRNGAPAVELVVKDDGTPGLKVTFPYVRSFTLADGERYETGWSQSLWFVHEGGTWVIDNWFAEPVELA